MTGTCVALSKFYMATIIILEGFLQIIGGKVAFTPASASFVGPLGLPVEYWSQICTRCNKSIMMDIGIQQIITSFSSNIFLTSIILPVSIYMQDDPLPYSLELYTHNIKYKITNDRLWAVVGGWFCQSDPHQRRGHMEPGKKEAERVSGTSSQLFPGWLPSRIYVEEEVLFTLSVSGL